MKDSNAISVATGNAIILWEEGASCEALLKEFTPYYPSIKRVVISGTNDKSGVSYDPTTNKLTINHPRRLWPDSMTGAPDLSGGDSPLFKSVADGGDIDPAIQAGLESGGFSVVGDDTPNDDGKNPKKLLKEPVQALDGIGELFLNWVLESDENQKVMGWKPNNGAKIVKWAASGALYANERGWGFSTALLEGFMGLYGPLNGECPVTLAVKAHYATLTTSVERVAKQHGVNATRVAARMKRHATKMADTRGTKVLSRPEIANHFSAMIRTEKMNPKPRVWVAKNIAPQVLNNFCAYFLALRGEDAREEVAARAAAGNRKMASYEAMRGELNNKLYASLEALIVNREAEIAAAFYEVGGEEEGML